MLQKNPQYHIGIDLGTTHTVVAYAKNDKSGDIKLFDIAQLIAPGQVAPKPLLPSVRYHPAQNELIDDDLIFAQPDSRAIIGEAARLLGAKTKGRLVTSAKSWLSHPSVDQHAEILPWGSDDQINKVSPVEASASYLRHVRTVWSHAYPDAPLEHQDIVLTVPASFDESARLLTLEAAKRAGLNNLKLLEEPQAVCYDWLRRHSTDTEQALTGVHLLLVCDVGGGTTDLTLIKVDHSGAKPKLTRIAVGDHILLGGDNIDLALAHFLENRLLTDQSRLSAADFSQLIEQCRSAKERLLAEDAPEQVNITLLGGGSKLIGGSRTTYLTHEEAKQIALDGFFPMTNPDDFPDKKRSGVMEFGLPYAAEPAISKHIAAFLNLHQESSRAVLGSSDTLPDAILLNGGLFRSKLITQRLIEIVSSWKSKPVILLENTTPEYAVAKGAASYAIARLNKKAIIGGGSPRSFFLLVDTYPDVMKATKAAEQHGICVLPKGSEEGKEFILQDRHFTLRTGIPVRFDLLSYSGDNASQPGELVEITEHFRFLPPLILTLDDKALDTNKDVIVQLSVCYTNFGTLKIQCIPDQANNQANAARSQKVWDLEFQIRKQNSTFEHSSTNLPPRFNEACEKIKAVFGPKSKQIDPNAVKNLRSDLEKILGCSRSDWDTGLLRALFSVLWEGQKFRRRSEHHERVWLGLTGFCLRPGFGHPLDEGYIEQFWELYPQGIQFTHEIQNWAEWWTCWRRIAGGLDAANQHKIFKDIANFINPASARQASIAKQAKQRSYDDMVKLTAVLERLPIESKIQLGGWILKRLEKASEPKQTWWALGRIAARIPCYGSSHTVIPEETASVWLNKALAHDWKLNPQIALAATLMCRKSGDRVIDINESLRLRVLEKLKLSKAPNPWLELVAHYQELDKQEENQFFGESLPPGLKLLQLSSKLGSFT